VFAKDYAQSDSLLGQAERLDPRWIDPVVRRGWLDYWRSRPLVDDPPAADRWITRGLGHAERALAIDRDDPDALELRGDLRYWRWLLGVVGDPALARQLLLDAQTDLETAVRLRPSQAGAWATLSHLYYQTKQLVDVNLAARRALESDAFLSNADKILERLFYSSFDAGQFSDAEHWCGEGRQRFPADPKFTECRLLMMTSRQVPPDVPRAWRLLDSLMALTDPRDTAYQRRNAQLMVAGVLARAGAGDSARHLIERSRGDAVMDPTRDLTLTAAMMYTLLDDKTHAIDELKVYLAANPSKRSGLAQDAGWQFRSLENDPQFRQLVGSAP
jgi:hypothetical protein